MTVVLAGRFYATQAWWLGVLGTAGLTPATQPMEHSHIALLMLFSQFLWWVLNFSSFAVHCASAAGVEIYTRSGCISNDMGGLIS